MIVKTDCETDCETDGALQSTNIIRRSCTKTAKFKFAADRCSDQGANQLLQNAVTLLDESTSSIYYSDMMWKFEYYPQPSCFEIREMTSVIFLAKLLCKYLAFE